MLPQECAPDSRVLGHQKEEKVAHPKAANGPFTAAWWKVVGNGRLACPSDHTDKQNWNIIANRMFDHATFYS